MELASHSNDIPYQTFLEYLQNQEKLSKQDLHKALRVQSTALEKSLPNLLVKLGLCSELDIAKALSESTDLAIVSPEDYPAKSPFAKDILAANEAEICIALSDPEEQFVQDVLSLATGKHIVVKVGLVSEINAALEIQYGDGKSLMDQIVDDFEVSETGTGTEDLEHLKDLASEAPVIKVVNLMLQKAVEMQASDIHIEPFEQYLKVRLRIDGVLQDIESPPVSSIAAVISRIKIMATLNIAERRLPQDGRIKLQMSGKELDLRVSTIPTMHGESVVIRLLDKETTVLDFKVLGLTGKHAQQFIDTLSKPHGIVLVTGPTGSGKTTTMYTALKQLNTQERKIITVEDPVEYQLDGVNQIQAKPLIGLTFASALRSIVRQDPDVIMIGEMRDIETARIAVQSALTGHLVLSTLHTNNAAGGITRLLDMGVEEYLLSSTVNGILAQRLVRKLCSICKASYPVTDALAEEMQLNRFAADFSENGKMTLFKPVGCSACGGIGYQGRIAIIEFLVMTDVIRKQIMEHEEGTVIQKQAIASGMMTMSADGMIKSLQGVTSLEEVLRVTTD